jgi:hypothetical protein
MMPGHLIRSLAINPLRHREPGGGTRVTIHVVMTGVGEIASGVPHSNPATLRFPGINGNGRPDYVCVGESGLL